MLRRLLSSGLLAAFLTLAANVSAHAQTHNAAPPPTNIGALSPDKPGRDPSQPIDEQYTRKNHESTTEPFFLSPLVDYLPASRTVPTPEAVLGDIAGAKNNLPYSREVYA